MSLCGIKTLQPLYFFKLDNKPGSSCYQYYHHQYKRLFIFGNWNTANINSEQAGQKAERQKDSSHYREDIHGFVHLLR